MARSVEEIEESIQTEAAKYPELDALTSNTSKVSFWKYTIKVVAFVAHMIELLFDRHKEEVNAIIVTTEIGTLDWYKSVCLSYQHGDNLVLINNIPSYFETIQSKQIVKKVAISEDENSILVIKVAKEVDGGFVRLIEEEKAGLSTYLSRVKIAGTPINLISEDADTLEITATIKVSNLVFNAEGKLLADSNQSPVLEAIKKYLKDVDFGATLYLSRLIDVVMDIDGVIDFVINTSSLNRIRFVNSTKGNAGHFNLDEIETIIRYELL